MNWNMRCYPWKGHLEEGLEHLEGMWACITRRKAQKWKAKLAFIIILIWLAKGTGPQYLSSTGKWSSDILNKSNKEGVCIPPLLRNISNMALGQHLTWGSKDDQEITSGDATHTLNSNEEKEDTNQGRGEMPQPISSAVQVYLLRSKA